MFFVQVVPQHGRPRGFALIGDNLYWDGMHFDAPCQVVFDELLALYCEATESGQVTAVKSGADATRLFTGFAERLEDQKGEQ
jgi:hypothetical protein